MLVRLLLPLILISVSSAFAVPPVKGFETFDEFFIGLEELSPEEFEARGKLTSSQKLIEWHEVLLDSDPKNYRRWNTKLKSLPTMGFGHPKTGQWILRVKDARIPEIKTSEFEDGSKLSGFLTIQEFYGSLLKDPTKIFEERISLTDSRSLERWKNHLDYIHSDLVVLLDFKLTGIGVVGYIREDDEELAVKPKATQPVGFHPKGLEQTPPKRIQDLKEFYALIEKGDVTEFMHRHEATRLSTLRIWVTSLAQNNFKLYRKYRSFFNTPGKVEGFQPSFKIAGGFIPPCEDLTH